MRFMFTKCSSLKYSNLHIAINFCDVNFHELKKVITKFYLHIGSQVRDLTLKYTIAIYSGNIMKI